MPLLPTPGNHHLPAVARMVPAVPGVAQRYLHSFPPSFDRLDPWRSKEAVSGSTTSACWAKHIAIDGKTLRHSGGGSSPMRQLHLVSAWATDAKLILGQVATEEMSSQIRQFPNSWSCSACTVPS